MSCRFYHHGGDSIEWVEQDEPRGMRIVPHDPKWTNPSQAMEGGVGAGCKTCPGGQIANANFRLAVGDFPQARTQDLEAALSPDAVALIFASPPYGLPGATFRAKADAVPVSIGDLTGLARRIGIERPGGWAGEVIAMWVGKGCVSVFALLTANSAVEIATDGLDVFARAIGAEWYKPAPNWSNTPLKSFGLGDGFRPEEWGLR
jgi:hypothetical protein